MRTVSIVVGLVSAFCAASAHSEAYPTEQLAAISCGAAQTQLLPNGGGVLVDRTCGNFKVSGVGSSTGAAAANSTQFVGLAQSGMFCSFVPRDAWTFPGGFVGNFHCYTPSKGDVTIASYGTSMTDFGTEAFEASLVYEQTGVNCLVTPNDADIKAFAGGFILGYSCSALAFGGSIAPSVRGAGSTVSDASQMTRRLLTFAAGTKTVCRFQSVQLTGLTFNAKLYCGNTVYQGIGSTVTQAANDAAVQAGI